MPEKTDNIEPTQQVTQPEEPAGAGEPAPAKREPFEIAILPLQNTVLFPETVVPLAVGRPRSVAALEAALATEEKLLGCITVRPEAGAGSQETKAADLYDVGTLVMIKRMERVEDTMHIIAQGTDRIRIVEWKQENPFLRAVVEILPEVKI